MKHTYELPRLMDPCGRMLFVGLRTDELLRQMLKAKGDFHVAAIYLIDDPRNSTTGYEHLSNSIKDLTAGEAPRVTLYYRDLRDMIHLFPGTCLNFAYVSSLDHLDIEGYHRLIQQLWFKVRGGGILAGSHYTIAEPKVISAVNKLCHGLEIKLRTTWGDTSPTWYITK